MVKITIEIISMLLFISFVAWIMFILFRGIWNSVIKGPSLEKTINDLTEENNRLKERNSELEYSKSCLEKEISDLQNSNTKKTLTTIKRRKV